MLRHGVRRRRGPLAVVGVFALAAMCVPCKAQVSFGEAIRLAAENSPRVKAAQNDLLKAQSGLVEAKDFYVPSVVVGGGAGWAYGITLTVPTIFTVSTQSEVFSFQQQSYVRAARSNLQAAQLALQDVRQQVEEDAAITFLSLENAQERAKALSEQNEVATKLAAIMQDRLKASLEDELEIRKYQRGAIQIRLAKMEADDNVEDLRGHLGQMMGISAEKLEIMPESIPTISTTVPANSGEKFPDTPGTAAAVLNDKAKEERARGDAKYTWRPQVGFGASYGRISPINDVQEFYNLHGNYNAASLGVSIQFPIIDKVRKQAAKQSELDVAHSMIDLDNLRSDEMANRHKLARSIPELQAKAELADIDYEIAQNEAKTAEVQSQQATGAPPVTPKEVENARIEELQKYVEMLNARLEERKAQITFLRLTSQLDSWLKSIGNDSAAKP
jgi:outer membrane protein TolC